MAIYIEKIKVEMGGSGYTEINIEASENHRTLYWGEMFWGEETTALGGHVIIDQIFIL